MKADLQPGSVLPAYTGTPLTVTDFVRYQGASGDMNPIHHDTEFANVAGYPGPFAVGMLAAGVLSNYVTDRFGPANLRRLKVRFRAQAWPGDILTYRGIVTDVREVDGVQLLDLDLECIRQDGDLHVTGSATVVLPD